MECGKEHDHQVSDPQELKPSVYQVLSDCTCGVLHLLYTASTTGGLAPMHVPANPRGLAAKASPRAVEGSRGFNRAA